MDIDSTKLTVFFEAPFWIGVFERIERRKLSVCKVVFGAEPKDYEVWEYLLKNYSRLRFSPSVETVDPIFELYGNFVKSSPEWLSGEVAAKYAGCTLISGNFLTISHAFRLVTDEPALISRLSSAIAQNKETEEYHAARQKMLDELPTLTKENARKCQAYAWPGGWLKLTRVYRITEQEANDNSLLYLDRWEGVDHNGVFQGAAFHDGDQISTTKNWKL